MEKGWLKETKLRDDIIWDSYYGEGDIGLVQDFEKSINQVLPTEYKKIVSKYNGAVPEPDALKFYSRLVKKEVVIGVGVFLAYGNIESPSETMEWSYTNRPENFPKNFIAFSLVGNGDMICFDYNDVSQNQEPKIVIWHHEASQPEELFSPLADNFSKFLDVIFFEED